MTKKTENEVIEKKPHGLKGKPSNGKNSPVIGDNGLMLLEGDNNKYMNVNIILFNMEKIDLHSVDAVGERLNEFFMLHAENDMKPTVAGMAMALGMNRKTLWAIVHDGATGGSGYKSALPSEVALIIKRAHGLMENMWEMYMLNGKINPVSGIFLGKNNFGYQDKTEYVVTPNTRQDDDYNAEDIRSRYLIDSSDSKND